MAADFHCPNSKGEGVLLDADSAQILSAKVSQTPLRCDEALQEQVRSPKYLQTAWGLSPRLSSAWTRTSLPCSALTFACSYIDITLRWELRKADIRGGCHWEHAVDWHTLGETSL